MKNIKITVAIILAIFLLVPLVSCNDGGTASIANESKNSTSETSNEESRYAADVPDTDFNNEFTVTFLIRNHEHGIFETWDFEQHEKNSDIINDALEARNNYIEEKYKVKLESYAVGGERNGGQMLTAIREEALSEQGLFDVVYSSLYDAVSLASEGAFYDLSELPHINLQAPWWDEKALDNLSLANRTFFAIGDISIQINDTLPVILFNKQMVKDGGLDNPYDLVKSGKWTLDKFEEMAKGIYKDNGDSVIDIKDTFGIGGQNDTMYNLFYNTGGRSFELDKSGNPQISFMNDKNVSAFTKIYNIMNDKQVFMSANYYANIPGFKESPVEYIVDAFTAGRMLFYAEGMLHVPEMRDSLVDFGLLPLPKYDEDQEDYYHLLGAWGATVVAIPRSNKNEKNTALIVEALAAESKNTLAKAYYEKILRYRNTRDNESEAMLDIIINTKSIDMGFAYRWGNLPSILVEMLNMGEPNFASMYEAREEVAKTEMQRAIETFSNLPHYIEE